MVVIQPLILVLGSKNQMAEFDAIEETLDRLGALTVIAQPQIGAIHRRDSGTEEQIIAWASKADGIMVYPDVYESRAGRRIARACKEAASRLASGGGRPLETVPVLHGADLGADQPGAARTAAWIATWCDRNRPDGKRAAAERREARRRSARREDDLPYLVTERDEVAIRNVETGDIAARIPVDLSVCRTIVDAKQDMTTQVERLDAAFEAYRVRENERAGRVM